MAKENAKKGDLEDFESLQKKLKVIFGLREKVAIALDKIYTKGSLTAKEVTEYLDNPSNFSAYQFDNIQKRRTDIQAFIWEALGEKTKKQIERKKLKKKAKKRSRKSLGHRRKWLEMD
ncbi:MAG: hypothetical protein K940chlam3_01246 [Chlamydiae bacterium]|nr:hypothetical protein [Chlamydiota bacterium]